MENNSALLVLHITFILTITEGLFKHEMTIATLCYWKFNYLGIITAISLEVNLSNIWAYASETGIPYYERLWKKQSEISRMSPFFQP